MDASPRGRRQKLSPQCKRGSLSTASSKLVLPSSGRTWVLTGPWHGPMPPRTVLSLPTTCHRFHRPRPPNGIFHTDRSTPGTCVPCPSARTATLHRSLSLLRIWRFRPVSRETQVVSTSICDPLNKLSPSTAISHLESPNSNWRDVHVSAHDVGGHSASTFPAHLCCGFLHWKSSSSQHPNFSARCTMMAKGVELTATSATVGRKKWREV